MSSEEIARLSIERGWDVHAVSSRPQASPLPNVTWHEADLFDSARLTSVVTSVQATLLPHLAWYVIPGKSGSSLTNMQWLQASLALLQQFRACGGQRVVVAGSSFEYDWRYGYCSEQLTPTNPNTLYGACKDALRSVLEEYARETGLSQAWPRIFFLYGPHEHHERLIPAVVRALLRGEIARYAEFTAAVEQIVEVSERICEARPVAGTDAPPVPEGEKGGSSPRSRKPGPVR